jgi:copper chaperone
MKTDKILVANLKCSGCVNTITKKVSEIAGVHKVIVDPEQDAVTVEYDETTPRTEITKTLHSLGYPEATEENGLLLQLKSYASCMIGRINK